MCRQQELVIAETLKAPFMCPVIVLSCLVYDSNALFMMMKQNICKAKNYFLFHSNNFE